MGISTYTLQQILRWWGNQRGGNGQRGREKPTGCLRGKFKAGGYFGNRGLNGKMIVKYV
jgi:hypothetical protein